LNNTKDITKYKELKHESQKQIRKAYWKYIEDIVTPSNEKEEKSNCMKRFWSYIKHKKSEITYLH